MNWLTPTTGIIAAAVAVPLLVAMYFLRLRRTIAPVSSTLLWRRAVQDLQVNAPFQRLRRNLLLLLQLLAIGCLLVGLAGPVLSMDSGPARRYVLLIDRSASMNTTDGPEGMTRLDQARQQARKIVQSLRSPDRFRLTAGPGGGDQAMVIAFDQHAKVMCSFTTDSQKLLDAIDAIEPSDGRSELGEAMALARAFAQQPAEAGEHSGQAASNTAQIELFSDGRLAGGDALDDAAEAITFHAIGTSSENVGIVAMQARRSYERPEQVDVFASLANYSSQPAQCDVELVADGNIRSVRTVTIPPRRPSEEARSRKVLGPPGQVGVTFSMNHSGRVVMVRHSRKDARPDLLAADDVAWAVLPPPRRLNVLLVSDGNPALTAGLRACPVAQFRQVNQAEFLSMLAAGGPAPLPFDLAVLDNLAADAELPAGRYLSFGRPPRQLGLSATPGTELRRIIDWQAHHPVLQHIALDNLVTQKWWRLQADSAGGAGFQPADGREAQGGNLSGQPRFAGQALARFVDGPAILLGRRHNSVFLVVGFDVMESNWPFDAGFAMFCYNVTAFLGSEMSEADQTALPVGGVITVQGSANDAGPANIAGPAGLQVSLAAQPGQVYRFADTRRVGVYAVTAPAGAVHRFAVNLLDIEESDIAPAGEIRIAGQAVAATTGPARLNQELWPWLVLAGLAVVCIEWLVYNSRVRL